MKALIAFVLSALIPATPRVARASDQACQLPRQLQAEIFAKYPTKKIVTLSDLNEDDRGLFEKEHAASCPGLVSVDFYGDRRPTLAMVLIDSGREERRSMLVVAHRVGRGWSTRLLDRSTGPVPVVWRRDPGAYQDVYGRKKLMATRPVIVFCGYEAWAILYTWINGHVAKIWLSD